MKIGSLSEYLEALQEVENYYSSHTCEELMVEFKNLFPLGTPVYDVDENYLGDVISREIEGTDRFLLNLEYNEQVRSIEVKSIERTLSSVPEIPVTKVGFSPVIKWNYSSPFRRGTVLAHRILSNH